MEIQSDFVLYDLQYHMVLPDKLFQKEKYNTTTYKGNSICRSWYWMCRQDYT